MVMMPRERAQRLSSRTGKSWPDWFVMWQKCSTLVRGVTALAADLSQLPDRADAGTLSRRLNNEVAGARSLVMGTYRAMPLPEGLSPEQAKAKLLEIDPRWDEPKYWQAIARNASPWTANYLLASVDLRRGADGSAWQDSRLARCFWRDPSSPLPCGATPSRTH